MMLQVRLSRSLNFQFGAFAVLLVLIHSCGGQRHVIGPSQPIVATVGDDIILPCHLEPAMNAFGMTLEWGRPDLDPRFVYVWRDGVELESKKHPSYKGRTSMFVDELETGNISLRISKVKMSDAGRYRCFVPDVGKEAIVHLVVAQPRVIGPSQPIVATIGDDVILPCRLDPAMNAFGMTLEWTNPDLDPTFVYVWRDGVELESKKHPSYKGRTSMFVDELANGNISLMISKVKMSDAGRYRCFVPEVEKEAIVDLVVGAASSPIIQMTKNSGSIDLQCNSTGWYPEPEVFWLDGEGNLLSAGPPETVRGPDDLYTVSSRVTVEKRHSNSFTCRVTQKKTNQTRETQIQVPDDFFVVPPGSSPSSPVPAIVGAVLGIMFVLLAVFAGCFLWKWRRNKLKNKERSLEDGAELTKEEKTAGEEESVPLMSGREENDVNNESQSEKENLKLVAQRETQQDHLMITSELITDMGGAGAEGDNERVSLIQTERETHQQQEMMRRREQNDCVIEERQEKKKPDKEDSELPTVSISEGQREQPHNLQTDQEEKKEEETEEEKIMEEKQPRREEDETEETSETKTEQKDNEQQREDSKLMKQKKIKKERSEQKQRKEEKSRRMGQRASQSKKKVKDTMELKSQEDQKQEVSKLEPEDKKDKDPERNQNDRTRTREEEGENGKEEINEKSKKESEEKSWRPQLERQEEPERIEVRMKLPTQKKNDNQKVLDGSKQETGHEDKKGKVQEQNQSKVTRMTESKADSQILERTDITKEEGVNPSVSPAGPDRPDLRGHQETAERNKQEVQQVNELQTEKQQRDEPQRNERERKEQPERSAEVEEEERSAEVEEVERSAEVVEVERSAEVVEVEGKGGQEERTDGGADREETNKTSEEIEKHRQKKSDDQEETGEQLQESSKVLTQRGAESLDVVKEEETNERRFTHVTQRKDNERVKRKWNEEEVCHDDQQQTVGKRKKPEEEDTVQTEEDVKKTRQDNQMEVDEAAAAAHTEQEVTSDYEGMDCDSEPYHGSMCQEHQQDEQMQL